MSVQKRQEDRRIRRTRQALQRAFIEIMREQGDSSKSLRTAERRFVTTSIQDITDHANVNRGTFYLHFADKYMLVDAIAREHFRQQLVAILPADGQWNRECIRLLAHAVLDGFEKKYQHQQQPLLVLAPIIEQAVHDELTSLLLMWLQEARELQLQGDEITTIVRIVSATLLGTAIQWSQSEPDISLEEMAESISRMVIGGVASLKDSE